MEDLMTWEEFNQFKRVSKHQQESVLEWAAHLKHLQSILLAYNSVRASAKLTMFKYFWEGLRPSILAELQNKDL